jgi:hypothetical protein
MGFISVQQWEDEPIVVATFEGCIAAEDVRESDRHTTPLFQSIGTDAVLIIDTTRGDSSFVDILNILRQQPELNAAHPFTFEVALMLVGTHALAKLYVDAARQKQFGGVQIPMFACLEDAVEAARQLLQKAQDRLVS